MYIDARQLPDNTLIEGDICIIGAGAAGISMALDWMNLPYKVILLEGGNFGYEDKIQDLNKGSITGQNYFPLRASRLRYFGGTTGHWAGMCAPFEELDFKKRSWVPDSGWPFPKKTLDPYYEKAQKVYKLGPYEYDLDYWQQKEKDFIPMPLDENIIWNKMWQFCKDRKIGPIYDDTIKEAKNIHLYTHANTTNIKANENVSKITEINIKNLDGKNHTVKAKKFILACGTIQNVRLLLASNTQSKAGLGNQNDLVGRYFMEHIESSTADLYLSKELPGILYNAPFGTSRLCRAELAITEEAQREHELLNGTLGLLPLKVGTHFKPRMVTWQNEDPRKSADNMFANWREADKLSKSNPQPELEKAYQMDIRVEQAPNPNSRITLTNEKDALGVKLPNLNWELTALDKSSLRRLNLLVAKQVAIAGIGRVQLRDWLRDEEDDTFPDYTNGGWHHMGGARMNDDPKKGVVDANCKVHGLDNLFVAGSACYPTSGAPNPTLTLTALTLRLSDHLKNII